MQPLVAGAEGPAFALIHRAGPMVIPQTVGQARSLCPGIVRPGTSNCMALVKVEADRVKAFGARPDLNSVPYPSSYAPVDLRVAYNLTRYTPTFGTKQTIAIVDAYDDPNAEADLAVYRAYYREPVCSTANQCFKKVNELGGTRLPAPNGGWAGEISLDLDMVSAICPNCHILLLEASSNDNADLGRAVDEAVLLGANVVSNSYGGDESAPLDPNYVHPGHVMVASTGDGGYFPSSPASYATVIAVGGTTLTRIPSAGRLWTETAWKDGGSGCSLFVSKPAWQSTQTICPTRATADISAVADPNTGVAVYDSYPGSGVPTIGWEQFGGTSASAPIIGAVFALAGNAASVTEADLWAHGPRGYFYDITTGNDGQCPPVWNFICNARVGYDGPTGWGTPRYLQAF